MTLHTEILLAINEWMGDNLFDDGDNVESPSAQLADRITGVVQRRVLGDG